MDNKQKFTSFLESIKTDDSKVLVENIEKAFKIIFEAESSDPNLEHTIGNYYYDNKAGKYYDRSKDMYVDPTEVQSMLDAQGNAVRANNAALGKMLKLGLIDGNQYQKMHSRVMWPDEIMNKVFIKARNAGINISDLIEEAKAEV